MVGPVSRPRIAAFHAEEPCPPRWSLEASTGSAGLVAGVVATRRKSVADTAVTPLCRQPRTAR